MRPLPRTLLRVATVAATLAATVVAGPASAKPTTTINPAKLTAGAPVSVPHLEGKTVVDGTVRIPVNAPTVRLLGKSGSAYVVGTADSAGGGGRILRVAADGTTTKLGRSNIYMTDLSGDGATVISSRVPNTSKTIVTVRSATTGAVVLTKTFAGYVSVLDAEGDRVLLGQDQARTVIWTTSTGSIAVVNKLSGYEGDLSSDVVAGFTKDPYDGGCTVISRISTGERLWRSCDERVEAWSPDASRIITVGILSDGIGPGHVDVRRVTGRHLGGYEVKGWFGELRFETATAALLETHGRHKTALVRCTGTSCERASGLTDTEPLRVTAQR